MNGLAYLLAPLALVLPTPASEDAGEAALLPPVEYGQGASEREIPAWLSFAQIEPTPVQNQVRIERRVIIRVSPRRSGARQSFVTEQMRAPTGPRYLERPMGNCLPAKNIAAVQAVSGNRLLLHLRNRAIVSATLEKSCRARDFYSGFYVEPSDDGLICVDRDRLHSRTGATCQVSRMRQLIVLSD